MDAVAEAATQACNGIASQHAEMASKIPAAPGEIKATAAELFEGTLSLGKKEARFRIIQARAGNCEIP